MLHAGLCVTRGGEQVPAARYQSSEISFKPIGVVRTTASSATIRSGRHYASAAKSTIEVFPEFEPGLTGLEGCSHIFVLAYFHRLRPEQIGPLKVKPKGFVKRGLKLGELPTLGVFAVDSPTRPNPIGLTLARLDRIEGRRLTVTGLDYFDGTPVLDIKPYQEAYRVDGYTTSDWVAKVMKKLTKATP